MVPCRTKPGKNLQTFVVCLNACLQDNNVYLRIKKRMIE